MNDDDYPRKIEELACVVTGVELGDHATSLARFTLDGGTVEAEVHTTFRGNRIPRTAKVTIEWSYE